MNIKCAKLKNGDEIIFNVEPMLSVGDQSDFGSDTVDIKKVSLPEYTPIPGADDKKSKNINASLKDLIVTLSEDDRDDYTKVMRIKSFISLHTKEYDFK